MPRNKIGMTFRGFEELAEKFEKLDAGLKPVVTECLEESHGHVTKKLHTDMEKHRQTGDTEESIVDKAKVTWSGTRASVDVGFNIRKGGLPSIFLMYGTPRMAKDTKLYNDVYGTAVRREIGKMQEDIFHKHIDAIMEKS